jgi:hypothetical protein
MTIIGVIKSMKPCETRSIWIHALLTVLVIQLIKDVVRWNGGKLYRGKIGHKSTAYN